MPERLRVRLGGYAPEGSTHSRALDTIAVALRDEIGAEVEVLYNVPDTGRSIHELLTDVQSGALTACYLSTSYLVDSVPPLGVLDLPYAFDSLAHAHRCLDGRLGQALSEPTSARTGLRPLGYWDNGMRHLSNGIRPIHAPEDCVGLRVRLQPSWAHERFFEELGATPVLSELRDGVDLVRRGAVDAQENPLANFVEYGIVELHPHLTLTGHAYGARGFYAGAAELEGWTDGAVHVFERAVRTAIDEQRRAAEAKERELQHSVLASGTQVVEPDPAALGAFKNAARPVLEEAHDRLGPELLELIDEERETV